MAFVYKASPEHSRRLRELTGMPNLAEVVAYDSEEGGGEFPEAIFDGGVSLSALDPSVQCDVQEVIEEIAAEYGETVKFVAELTPEPLGPSLQREARERREREARTRWCEVCGRRTEHEQVTDTAWARTLKLPEWQCVEHGQEGRP